jgi:hypothetical protein
MNHIANVRADVSRIIDVTHECDDGWHTFTSEQIPGLFLTAHESDLENAYNDIGRAIEALILADYGWHVRVELKPVFSEYLKTLPPSHQPEPHSRRRLYYTVEDLKAA